MFPGVISTLSFCPCQCLNFLLMPLSGCYFLFLTLLLYSVVLQDVAPDCGTLLKTHLAGGKKTRVCSLCDSMDL